MYTVRFPARFYFDTRTSPGPGIKNPGGMARYKSTPTRVTTIRNNYYILFYIQYINVDFCVQIRFYRHGDFTKGRCSLIPTSHPARMSSLSNREPSTLTSRSPLCFSSPRSCLHPLLLCSVPSFLSLIKPFEQIAGHQHAAAADHIRCPLYGKSTNHCFHRHLLNLIEQCTATGGMYCADSDAGIITIRRYVSKTL